MSPAVTTPRRADRHARFLADARDLLALAEELHEKAAAFVQDHARMARDEDLGPTYRDVTGLAYAVEVFVSFTAPNLPSRRES